MDEAEKFKAECQQKFLQYCLARDVAPYHSVKRRMAEKAMEAVDDWLTYVEIQGL